MIVAYDVKRLADSYRFKLQHFGVTAYARELLDRFADDLGDALRLVTYAADDEDGICSLDRAVDLVERSSGRSVATNWPRPGFPGGRWTLRGMERIPRARRVIAPVQRRLTEALFPRTGFRDSASWDVFHSPIDPLPPAVMTGPAVRMITLHDVAYLRSPHWTSDRGEATRRILDSVDASRDWVICNSSYTLRDVQQLVPIPDARMCVTHLAASTAFDAPRPDGARDLLHSLQLDSGSYVLALGQKDPRKNLSRLMDAFARVGNRPEFSEVPLVIVTSSRDQAYFTGELVARQVAKSRYRVITGVSDTVLAGLYANARCFAYVSLYEGFGIPLIEAMRSDCCVLASNVTSIPEVAGDAAHYVDPAQVESIAAGLAEVLGNAERRASLRENGKRQAARFSWDKTARETKAFYEHALEVSRASSAR